MIKRGLGSTLVMSSGRPLDSSRVTRTSLAVSIVVVAGLLLSSLWLGVSASAAGAHGPSGPSPDLLSTAEASLVQGQGRAGGAPASCSASSSTSAACQISGLPQVAPANTTGGDWIPLNYSRAYTAIAYDARDGYVLAFGGRSPSGALGDTWEYAFGNWSIIPTSGAPPARWGAAMAYDGASGTVVMFGGENLTTYFNDTWVYSGGVWTKQTLAVAPSPRAFAGMAYDANFNDNYTVLYGGANATSTGLNDTWEYHAGSWTKLATTGSAPPAVQGMGLTYDNRLGSVLLFGGYGPSGYSGAAYLYQSGVWSIGPMGPPALAFMGMAYDRAATVKSVILMGGYDGSSYSSATWELTNQTWTKLTGPGPSARDGAALTFDGLAKDFYLVLWGGHNGASYSSDTWNFTASGWAQVAAGGHPGALSGAVLVGDPAHDQVVLFGGLGSTGATNATWIFRGGSWTLLCSACGPSPRYNASATYSFALNEVVLFGGTSGTTYFNDTWALVNGTTWTNVSQGVAPAARASAGFVFYSTPVNQTVLFGGTDGTTYFNDTWEFNGTAWTSVPVATHPSARAAMAMAYDGPDGYAVLFGGRNATTVFNDTWIFRVAPTPSWNLLAPGTHPAARYGAVAMFANYNGYVLLTGGYNGTSFFNDTWGFAGGNWTRFNPPTFPPARSDAALAFDRTDQYLVEFGGSGSSVTFSDTWIWVAFSAVVSAAPNPTDVGVPVTFGVSVIEGVAPYTYSWSFGDGNTSTLAAPSHTYGAAGTYNVTLVVNDSKSPTQDQTSANLTVVVHPALSVNAAATPSVAVPGYTVVFNATPAGGTSAFTWTWSFGDGATASAENATHAYATVGTFNATVVVNDSVGATANRTVQVLIVPNVGAVVSTTPSPAATDVGVPIAFNSTPVGGNGVYTYAWAFGDGATASTQNATHSYSAPGTYTVRFVIESAGNNYSTTVTAVVAALPSATITVRPNPVGVGTPVIFNSTVTNGTGPLTFFWEFGDQQNATTNPATHTYAVAGTYMVTFVATDSVGQAANQSTTVTVAATPSVSGTATPSTSEVGVAVSFSATASGGITPFTYAWVFGDGSQGTGATPSHTYSASGTFDATVWANDSIGESAQSTVAVTVSPALHATVTASPASTDVGVVVSFDASISGGVSPVTYAWAFGDGGHGTGVSASHAYTTPGSYTVTVWANDSLSVSSVAHAAVTIVADPSVSAFTVAPTSVSSGNPVSFNATVSGGTAPFSWAYTGLPSGCGTTNQSSLSCRPSSTGTYSVEVTVTDAFGKTANATVSLTVTSSSGATFLGLPQTEGYLLLAAILIVIAVVGVLAVSASRRRKGKRPSPTPGPSKTPPASGGSAPSPPQGGGRSG